MNDQHHLDRINALTRNARQTWFALLAVLVFVGITLMGTEHIDFYGIDRKTSLPLVNVNVPTRFFFIAAPILIAAFYCYFHVYLIRLWDALGAAPPRLNKMCLGDAVMPWLITDAALNLRQKWRMDASNSRRLLETEAMVLNLILAWMFGLFVLATLWLQSMTARSFLITLSAGMALLISLFCGAASLIALYSRLSTADQSRSINLFSQAPAMSLMVVLLPTILAFSHSKTEGSEERLALVDLSQETVTERPYGWLPYHVAKEAFRAEWCARDRSNNNCDDFGRFEKEFEDEFHTRRQSSLADMRRPDWHRSLHGKPDFRVANLSGAFLAGMDMNGARLSGADLTNAELEGASLQASDLTGANMESAAIAKARLQFASMHGVNLSGAKLENSILFGVELKEANLVQANLENAVLSGASLERALLTGARLTGSDLSAARLIGTHLFNSKLDHTRLDFSQISGETNFENTLYQTDLSGSENHGGMLRNVDMRQVVFDDETDFRNSFLDASVQVGNAFRIQMGNPCQWEGEKVLSDDDFFGRWRGWIEERPKFLLGSDWKDIAPPEYRNVTPISPPEGCVWSTWGLPKALDIQPLTNASWPASR